MKPPDSASSSSGGGSPDAASRPELVERLVEEIRADGPIPFDRFMERALYDPDFGYYASGAAPIGPAGDFVTASDAGRHFGRCVARQLEEIDRLVGPFEPYDVFEFGAGRGLLARDVVDHIGESLPDLAGRLRYRIVDRAPAMRAAAGGTVPEATVVAPEAVEPSEGGCVVAVELFDALPVRRARRREGALVEVRVGLDEAGSLVEVEAPAGRELSEAIEARGALAEEGSEAEYAPTLRAQLELMASTIRRGVLLIVDYGDGAEALNLRERGTLLAYFRHETNERYLERVGRQDLTAHVDFTALERAAREIGLEVLGRTTQDRFLIGNGILDVFDEPDQEKWRSPAQVKARLQAMQLIHPSAMGRSFRVLMLAKGCDRPPRLSGLIDPFGGAGSRPRS